MSSCPTDQKHPAIDVQAVLTICSSLVNCFAPPLGAVVKHLQWSMLGFPMGTGVLEFIHLSFVEQMKCYSLATWDTQARVRWARQMGGCLCPWESSIPALLEARKSDSISLSLSATHPQCPRCQTAALAFSWLALLWWVCWGSSI